MSCFLDFLKILRQFKKLYILNLLIRYFRNYWFFSLYVIKNFDFFILWISLWTTKKSKIFISFIYLFILIVLERSISTTKVCVKFLGKVTRIIVFMGRKRWHIYKWGLLQVPSSIYSFKILFDYLYKWLKIKIKIDDIK